MESISVVVPIYNSGESLVKSVDSILNQTYSNIEIILVNDGSTDNSGSICDAYANIDNRVKVIHKKNGGQSTARNKGVQLATGKYLSFVDSGDSIEEDIYKHCMNLFKKWQCDVVDFESVFTIGEFHAEKISSSFDIQILEGKLEILRDYLYRGQTKKSPFTVWRKLYKRSLFENIYFPEGKINEDIVTNYKILQKCNKVVYTNKIGYYYYQDNESTTRGGLKRKDFDLLDASNELVQLTKDEHYKDIRYLAKVKLARSYFSLLAKIARYGVSDRSINKIDTIKRLTKDLRKNYFILMKSPMPLNRKLMVNGLCVNFNFVKLPLDIYKKIKS